MGFSRPGEPLIKAAKWLLYVVSVAIVLWPILTTTIVADDFYQIPYTYVRTKGSLGGLLDLTWTGVQHGHFNYLGQLIGNTTSLIEMRLLGFGLRASVVFFTIKLGCYLLVLSAITRLVTTLRPRSIKELWNIRIISLITLGSYLQLHVLWSIDPVSSFPLSGQLTAAIGLSILWFQIKSVSTKRNGHIFLSSVAVIFGTLYYESLATLILVVPFIALIERGMPIIRRVQIAVLGAIAPCATVSVLRFFSAESNTYSGTKFSYSGNSLLHLPMRTLDALPGTTWHLLKEYMGNVDWFNTPSLVLVATIALGVIPLLKKNEVDVDQFPIKLLVVVIVVWVTNTAVQTFTARIQEGSPRLGFVYTYHLFGVAAATVLTVSCLAYLRDRGFHKAMCAVLFVVISLLIVQTGINYQIRDALRFNEGANHNLLNAFSDKYPVRDRCEALRTWTNGLWPVYYRHGVVDGLQYSYKKFHDEEFCQGFEITNE